MFDRLPVNGDADVIVTIDQRRCKAPPVGLDVPEGATVTILVVGVVGIAGEHQQRPRAADSPTLPPTR